MSKRKAEEQEVGDQELGAPGALDLGPIKFQLRAVQNDLAMRQIVLDAMDVVVQGGLLTKEHYRNLDLVDSPNINMICNDLDALIHAAVRVDEQDLFSYLIARDDVDVMSQNANGDTILMIAVICNDLSFVERIMDWMCYVNMPIDLDIANSQGVSLSDLISAGPNAETISYWIEVHNDCFAEVPTLEESLGADAPTASGAGVSTVHSDSEVDNMSFRIRYLGAGGFEGVDAADYLYSGYNSA